MSFTVIGTYGGDAIRLDGPVDLPANTKVRVTPEPVPSPAARGFLATARELQVSGPTDWTTNFEKYLHGPVAGDD